MQEGRRKFLKSAATTSIAVGAGVGVVACSSGEGTNEKITRGKSKKEEVLYQKTKNWQAYYDVAK